MSALLKPRFEVFVNPDGGGYLLNIQAGLLQHLNTRVVVPLMPVANAPLPAKILNPQPTMDAKFMQRGSRMGCNKRPVRPWTLGPGNPCRGDGGKRCVSATSPPVRPSFRQGMPEPSVQGRTCTMPEPSVQGSAMRNAGSTHP
ncbi:MAG: CcdB family protein [Thiotrichales bacterium]